MLITPIVDAQDLRANIASPFEADVIEGLSRPQKSVPPKYFYDDVGSTLFDQICRTPEYYPTRVEAALLGRVSRDLAPQIAAGAALVEFGSGASEKTRILLDAVPGFSLYVPIDISVEALAAASARIASTYPGLRVAPLAADFSEPLPDAPFAQAPQVVGFFPGSTIGNFTPAEARAFLEASRFSLGPRAVFLIGVDLVKDIMILHAAYNDEAGVTAAFNLNLLARMNRELDADFQLDRFSHRAIWNPQMSRVEMHLESLASQTVKVAGRAFQFRTGETIHTENSHKFTPQSFAAIAGSAGWRVSAHWLSDEQPFATFLMAPTEALATGQAA